MTISLDQIAQQAGVKPISLDEMAQRANVKPITQPVQTGLNPYAVGAGKGIISTLTSAASLGEKMLRGTLKTILPQKLEEKFGVAQQPQQTAAEQLVPEELRIPQGQKEQAGYTVSEIGQLFIPTGEMGAITGLSKILKATKTLGQAALPLAKRAAIEGISLGGKRAIQTGGDLQETTQGLKLGAGFSTGLGIAGLVGRKIAPAIGEITSSVLANLIGKSPEHIQQAFRDPVTVAKAMARKVIPTQVREEAIAALNKYREEVAQNFTSGLQKLQKLVPSNLIDKGVKQILDIRRAKKMVSRAIASTIDGLPAILRQFRISVTKNDLLDFDKLNSSIISSSERNAIQRAYTTMIKQNNFTPRGVQDVAARIRALTKFTEGAKNVTSAVVGEMESTYHQAISNAYPSLGKLRTEYGAAQKIISGIDEVLTSVKDNMVNPVRATSAIKRLSSAFKEDNEAYLTALKRLEEISGQDFLSQLAATEFKNIAPATFGSRMAQMGFLAGGIFYNPFSLAILPLFSPKVVGKLTTGLGKIIPKLKTTTESIRQIIPKILAP